MKKVIYTAIIDDYDTVKKPLFVNEDFDYILFTNVDIQSDFWTVIRVMGSGVKAARKIKIRCDEYLKDYDLSIWLDANIQQKTDMNYFIKEMDKCDMITMQHPSRNCIYQEVAACLHWKKDKLSIMNKQVDRYKKLKYPTNNGLIASGILIRWHNRTIKNLMKDWNHEVQNYSHRDQLSFNYCLTKHDVKLGLIPYSVLQSHFNYGRHK